MSGWSSTLSSVPNVMAQNRPRRGVWHCSASLVLFAAQAGGALWVPAGYTASARRAPAARSGAPIVAQLGGGIEQPWGERDAGDEVGADEPWAGAGAGDAPATDWLMATTESTKKRRTKPIETVNVGVVKTAFKRRNGYYVEVAVQHAGAVETIHRLWFGFEVIADVAKLRGRADWEIDVERFGEAVVSYLQRAGVDLADPDWALDDDTVPFSSEHLPLRTLFDYYPDLMQALADECLAHLEGLPPNMPLGSDPEIHIPDPNAPDALDVCRRDRTLRTDIARPAFPASPMPCTPSSATGSSPHAPSMAPSMAPSVAPDCSLAAAGSGAHLVRSALRGPDGRAAALHEGGAAGGRRPRLPRVRLTGSDARRADSCKIPADPPR